MDIKEIQELLNKSASESGYQIISLQNQIQEMAKAHENELDTVFVEFLSIIDTFEKSESAIKERGLDQDENAQKAIKRLLNAKRKALFVLEKFNVNKIEFVDNMVLDDCCSTVDTEADPTRKDGEIVSIEKEGYKRNGHVIRRAEVVIVKN